MARHLNVHVHVDGEVYGPGDVVPDEVAGRITNPDVWDGDDDSAAEQPKRPAARSSKTKE